MRIEREGRRRGGGEEEKEERKEGRREGIKGEGGAVLTKVERTPESMVIPCAVVSGMGEWECWNWRFRNGIIYT